MVHQTPDSDLRNRLLLDNPWWATGKVERPLGAWPRRPQFTRLGALIGGAGRGRVVRLFGPRRIGKTVMLRQMVQHLIDSGVPPHALCYLTLDAPAYAGVGLERLLALALEGHDAGSAGPVHVFFDAAQARAGWDRQLAALAGAHPAVKVIAAASATVTDEPGGPNPGAASAADLHLPALGFAAFVAVAGKREAFETFIRKKETGAPEIETLNALLVDYVNHGGFPEPAFAAGERSDKARLLTEGLSGRLWPDDLPRLHGIADTGELARLLALLTLNAGRELTIEGLARALDIAKNTLRKYLDVLEAVFLIRRLGRLDGEARPFRRASHFKAYPTNPSLRAALFGPVAVDDPAMGPLAETAYLAQLAADNGAGQVHYARWKDGRVGFVSLDPESRRPAVVTDIAWDDRAITHPREELAQLVRFCARNGFETAAVTTRSSRFGKIDRPGVYVLPTAVLIYLSARTAAQDPL